MAVIQALIIDKNRQDAETLTALLQSRFPHVKVLGVSHTLPDAIAKTDDLRPGIVFLSVEFTGRNSAALFERLKRYDIDLIFTSVNEANAIQTIHHDTVDSLTVPVTEEMVKNALSRYFARHKVMEAANYGSYVVDSGSTDPYKFGKIVLPGVKGFSFVKLTDVVYVEADGNYSTIHLLNGNKMVSSRTLKYYQSILPQETFFRCHKCCIINLNLMKKVVKDNGLQVVMENGVHIDVADRQRKPFMDKIMPRGGTGES